MSTTVRLWADRFRWSGEIPTNYPGLRPRAIARINDQAEPLGAYWDGVDDSRYWQMQWDGTSALWGRANGRTGGRLQINASGAAVEQGRLELEHFSELWPTEDRRRVLIGGWFWQTYSMDFNPLIDTRATDPFVYLSTAGGTGDPRAQIYNANGELILDQYESSMPWRQTTDAYFLGMMVDGFAGWARLFSVHSDGRQWIGPQREYTGTPNWGCTANVDVFSLRHAGFWEAGFLDEIVVANPNNSFDLSEFVDDLAGSVWADGYQRPDRDGDFTVTDDYIRSDNSSNRTFNTGAHRASWDVKPEINIPSGDLLMSTDDGQTWDDAEGGEGLPETAEGILLRRQNMTLATGSNWTGLDLVIPDVPDIEVTPEAPVHDTEDNTVTVPEVEGVEYSETGTITIAPGGSLTVTAEPADGYVFPDGATTTWTFDYEFPPGPELAPIADVVIEQGEIYTVTLEWEIGTAAIWSVSAPSVVEASITDGTLTIAAGLDTGSGSGTVTLEDEHGSSVERSFEVIVNARAWDPGDPPDYPHSPIILWDDDEPAEVLIDATVAVATTEVNGEQIFEFEVPATHRHAGLIQNERRVQVAGETYWIRRVTTERSGASLALAVYAEARFYQLSTAAQINAQDFDQVLPGTPMQRALRGTDWSVDVVNVTTRRTYSVENTNPLELLREVQNNHGGDLVFDNANRRVSLVTQSGRDQGVGFFHGRGLTDSKRVVDTTSLITRLIPRNADGLGIESVNNGVAYIEDYSYTDEVRTATYNFDAGTSAFTMQSMAQATLANRSQPEYSYEATVNDLSAVSGEVIDAFDAGDIVTVVDEELGLEDTQRIVRLEYDVIRPWASDLTLSAKLRESGASDAEDSGRLETGTGVDTFDLVPFNLLLNSRFDNGLAHWASSGAEVIDSEQGTSDYAVRFEGSGDRWIEQTVQPDNRTAYAFSFDLDTDGPAEWIPDLVVQAIVTYEDGETETIDLDLA